MPRPQQRRPLRNTTRGWLTSSFLTEGWLERDEPGELANRSGAIFELERDRDGPHGRIMKYDLNRR